jgi:hypothetical protein
MVDIPHGGEIVPGVTNYAGMAAIDLDHFAKPRDEKLSREDAVRRQLTRASHAMGHGTPTFYGNASEELPGSVEMTPEERIELDAKVIAGIPASIARLYARIAAREAEEQQAA